MAVSSMSLLTISLTFLLLLVTGPLDIWLTKHFADLPRKSVLRGWDSLYHGLIAAVSWLQVIYICPTLSMCCPISIAVMSNKACERVYNVAISFLVSTALDLDHVMPDLLAHLKSNGSSRPWTRGILHYSLPIIVASLLVMTYAFATREQHVVQYTPVLLAECSSPPPDPTSSNIPSSLGSGDVSISLEEEEPPPLSHSIANQQQPLQEAASPSPSQQSSPTTKQLSALISTGSGLCCLQNSRSSVVSEGNSAVSVTLMLLVSVLSHHIRDAVRHGLWLQPLWQTSAFSQVQYSLATVALPLLVAGWGIWLYGNELRAGGWKEGVCDVEAQTN